MFQPSLLSRSVTLAIAGLAGSSAMAEQVAADDQPHSLQLDAVSVTASEGATKTETPFLETPQTVSVISPDDWESQGARSVQQAARYSPGVGTNQVGASNRYDYLILRGFSDGSINNTYLDGLRVMNDGGSYSSFVIDPWFLDRVELVKGPASVLYGQGSPGGLVALSSKQPEFERSGEVRLTTGSHQQGSLAFDLTGPVDDDHAFAYRLTGLASGADGQQDFVKEERYAIAPSITGYLTDDTSLTVLAYLQHEPEGGYHSGLPYEGTVEPRNGQTIDNTFFEGEPGYDRFERDTTLLGYDLEHSFTDNWTVRQKARYLSAEVSLAQVYAYGWANDTELTRYYSGGDEQLQAVTLDNQVQADLRTGPVEHRVLVGVDYQQRDNEVVWSSGVFPNIDAFDPDYGAEPSAMYPAVRNERELRQTGLYLQDQLALGGWHLTVGGRHDWVAINNTNKDTDVVAQLDDTQFSGRAGLVYAFESGVAPYASYSTSFSPSAYTDEGGDLLAPSQGRQIEAGVKVQPTGSQDQYSLSLFRIHQEDLATKLPQESFYRSIGEMRSQGVELEARSQLTDQLKVQASYAYTDVTFEQSEPYREGKTASQVPRHQLNVWADYRLGRGLLEGGEVGLGVRHAADIYADDANTKKVPDYTLLDLTVGYDFGALGANGLTSRVTVNNLLDESYVASCYNSLDFCYFGAERTITAAVSYAF